MIRTSVAGELDFSSSFLGGSAEHAALDLRMLTTSHSLKITNSAIANFRGMAVDLSGAKIGRSVQFSSEVLAASADGALRMTAMDVAGDIHLVDRIWRTALVAP
jgi:hypothetical protein